MQTGLDGGNYRAANGNDETFEQVFEVEGVERGGFHEGEINKVMAKSYLLQYLNNVAIGEELLINIVEKRCLQRFIVDIITD